MFYVVLRRRHPTFFSQSCSIGSLLENKSEESDYDFSKTGKLHISLPKTEDESDDQYFFDQLVETVQYFGYRTVLGKSIHFGLL